MKDLILGGGLRLRLYPLTHATDKYSLPLHDTNGGSHAGEYLCLLPNGRHLNLHQISPNRDAGTFESLYRSNVFWAEKALGGTAALSTPAQKTVAQH